MSYVYFRNLSSSPGVDVIKFLGGNLDYPKLRN